MTTAHDGQSFDLGRLAREGWIRRAVTDEPRLSEQVAMYRELGQEVLLVPVLEACESQRDDEGCTVCFEGAADPSRYQMIFTREAGREPAKDSGPR